MSLISRHIAKVLPKTKVNAPARKKLATQWKAKRKLQKAGEYPNVRKKLMDKISKKYVSDTQHKVTISPQVNKKKARFSAQKSKSVSVHAGMGRPVRSKARAELLKTHVHST